MQVVGGLRVVGGHRTGGSVLVVVGPPFPGGLGGLGPGTVVVDPPAGTVVELVELLVELEAVPSPSGSLPLPSPGPCPWSVPGP